MPDGSNCKHRNSCSKGVKAYKNSQCGGAKDVTIVYPEQPKKPKKSCSIGVHTVSFSCHSQPPFTRPPITRPTLPPPATYTPTSTSDSKPVETTPTYVPDTSVYSSVVVTSYVSTSTILTYSVSTVTTCDSSKGTNGTFCGGNGGVTTTVVTYPTTTVYEVTETNTIPATYTPAPPPSTYVPEEPSTYVPEEPSTYVPEEPSTYVPGEPSTYLPSTTKPSGPQPTLPCPSVVPQCLNTFLFLVQTCKDNSDHACYCPSTIFIESIFSCVYAHGETDTIISEAIIFVQGLCAPYVPVNPGIVTCATPTAYITPTLTYSVPQATYTTVTVTATTVVPCTDDKGIEIPGSSTTSVYPTYVPVPQVGLITGPSGGVGFVPVATPVQAGVVKPTSSFAAKPTGTGSFTPSKPTGVVTAGAGRNGAFAAAGLVAAAVAALL